MFLMIGVITPVAYCKVDLVTLPSRNTVQLTIYNSADMTLVRESRALTLKDGKNKLQFSWANTLIDPTSLEMLPKASADKIDMADLTYPPGVRHLGLARRQYPYGRPGEPVPMPEFEGAPSRTEVRKRMRSFYAPMAKSAERPKEIKKEGLSEYFLYTIEGTETIPTGWSKRLMSFDVDEVPVINLYKFEQERYGNSTVRFLSFKNDEEHKLGETPIPGGMLKVYRGADDKGHLAYTGQSAFKYIPVDEDVELNLGAVGDVVVEPALMDFETKNYRFDRKRNISGWDEVRRFKIEVKNTRDIGIKVEIKRNFPTQYWKLNTSQGFEKVDLDTIKFTLNLKPRSKQAFEYTLTTYHGVRQEGWTKTAR